METEEYKEELGNISTSFLQMKQEVPFEPQGHGTAHLVQNYTLIIGGTKTFQSQTQNVFETVERSKIC